MTFHTTWWSQIFFFASISAFAEPSDTNSTSDFSHRCFKAVGPTLMLSLILLKGRTMAYQQTWGNSLLLPWDSWLFQESCPSSFSQNLRLVSLKIINDQTHSKLALKAKENEKRHCTWNQSSSNPSLPGLKSSFWELLHCLTQQDKRGNSPRSWEEAGWVEDWAASSWHHFATKNLPNHCGETPGQRNPMSKLKLFQPLNNC